MNKRPSFFRQALVLIDRYFHIFFNDKQNLILTIAIPLLTILIVCAVAAKDMYSVKPEHTHSINAGYPVLVWEEVKQEEEDKVKGGTKIIGEKNKEDDDKEDDKKDDDKPETWKKKEINEYNIASKLPAVFQKINDEHYFLITNAEQVVALSKVSEYEEFRDYLNCNYTLQCDIDFENQEIDRIGNSKYPFTGTFNGNAHTISNFKITGENNVALFADVKSKEKSETTESVKTVAGKDQELTTYHNGIVKNLCIKNASINAENNCAVIAAILEEGASVNNCCVKDSKINSKGDNTGAIVGNCKSDRAEVYSVYANSTDIDSKGNNVGGLVGNLSKSRLSAGYYVGSVKGKKSKNCGMLVGTFEDSKRDTLKNLYYLSDGDSEHFVVKGGDYSDGMANRIEKEDLKRYSSFLVPFKGIRTAYDIEHNNYSDDEWKDRVEKKANEKKDSKYDPETDKDLDDEYDFKKDDQLAIANKTQTGLFMLACVAVFVGICNSIQEICKERNILKREYMTNLSLGSYVVSKLVVQAVVCAVQMVIVVAIFALFVSNKYIPDKGVFTNIWIEYYITLTLLAFSADTMALVISSLVKNSSTANTFIPIVLIVQIVFSGVLFPMDNGAMEIFSNLMVNKWGIAALAASSVFNDSRPELLIRNSEMQLNFGSSMTAETIKNLYASTTGNLLKIWGILILFIIVCSVACRFLLIRVKNDKR